MTFGHPTTPIAELPSWITTALTTDALDLATSLYSPRTTNNTADSFDLFEHSLADGEPLPAQATEVQLEPTRTLRNDDGIYHQTTTGEVIRMTFSPIVHHRAKLGSTCAC